MGLGLSCLSIWLRKARVNGKSTAPLFSGARSGEGASPFSFGVRLQSARGLADSKILRLGEKPCRAKTGKCMSGRMLILIAPRPA